MAKKKSVRDHLAAIADLGPNALRELDSIMFSRRVRERLIDCRRSAGMTQADLARTADMSIEQVREIEETPFFDLRVSTAARYAHACGGEMQMQAIPMPPEPEDAPDD